MLMYEYQIGNDSGMARSIEHLREIVDFVIALEADRGRGPWIPVSARPVGGAWVTLSAASMRALLEGPRETAAEAATAAVPA